MAVVRVGSKAKCALLALVIPLICGGCAGISATPAISPLMFLLPGLGQVKPASPQNAPPTQIASDGDLSQIN
jgi:hypothetical protein